MIENYLDTAIIIDDQPHEIENLLALLQEKDIWVRHHLPASLKERKSPLKPCKLVFLDLEIEPDKDLNNNISIIRRLFSDILGLNFGNYGIVVWSKHAEYVQTLREKINNDKGKYTLPLYIVSVDKTKYLKANNFDTLLDDIDQALLNDIGATFFLYWDRLVDQGKVETIQNIFSTIPFSPNEQDDLRFILYKLALNHTGIPAQYAGNYKLENDAVKALADMLHYEVVHKHQQELSLFGDDPQKLKYSGDEAGELRIYAMLNSKLFLDFKNLDQQYVIPGNVYQILEKDNIFDMPGVPEDATKIVIEMTPPCDFAVDKKAKMSKVLAGFYVKEMSGTKQKEFSKEYNYKELDGLLLQGIKEPQIFRFDFRYNGSINEADLRNDVKYKLLFRVKDKLFADILQKLSSYSSRLGIPMIKKTKPHCS